jgi:5-formyltetrahydrofolate cyclo-ligase
MTSLLAQGHRLLLPRAGRAKRLEFALVADLSVLVRGPFGAFEPPDRSVAVPLVADDLVLLPGVAFDHSGARLGRGGGWYDRSLPDAVEDLFGIAFAFQVLDRIPATTFDRRVRGVFTERGLRLCRRSGASRDPLADPS